MAHRCTVAWQFHRSNGLLALHVTDVERCAEHPRLPPFDACLRYHSTRLGAHPSHHNLSFHAHALDVPTFVQGGVRRQLAETSDGYNGQAVVWQSLTLMTNILKGRGTVGSDDSVLGNSMLALRIKCCKADASDYLKMRGWKSVISSTDHWQEFVAGNLADHAMSGIIMTVCFSLAEFKKASEKVGSHNAEWNETEDMIDIWGYGRPNFYQPLSHIPQVVNIPNLIPDGVIPFPEDTSKIRCGISIECRDVSFKYPESDQYTLRNILFHLDAGQLCVGLHRKPLRHTGDSFSYNQVIVGVNGSGKSTILKLVTRIYDPDEVQILLGGAEDLIDKLPDGFDTYLERPVDDK
ncbi:hypothetical protein C8Q74DRAFT_1220273 [Fomes fomentarius]|nr:hypothetical protein C8Q74DRAFT_1220273 [Fomes fomentarius]